MAESENRPPVDMSPEAMDQRLRDVAELYRLGMSLTGITYFGQGERPVAARTFRFRTAFRT